MLLLFCMQRVLITVNIHKIQFITSWVVTGWMRFKGSRAHASCVYHACTVAPKQPKRQLIRFSEFLVGFFLFWFTMEKEKLLEYFSENSNCPCGMKHEIQVKCGIWSKRPGNKWRISPLMECNAVFYACLCLHICLGNVFFFFELWVVKRKRISAHHLTLDHHHRTSPCLSIKNL